MSALRSFLRLFGRGRRALAAAIAVALLQTAALLPVPPIAKRIFDTTLPDEDTGELVWLGLAVLGCYLLSSALGLAARTIAAGATTAALADLRTRVVAQVVGRPASSADATSPSRLHATIAQDSERADHMAYSLAVQILPSALVCLGLAAVLLWISPLLLLTLVAFLPLAALANRLVGRQLRTRVGRWQRAGDRFSAHVAFVLRGHELIVTRSAEELEAERARRIAGELSHESRSVAVAQSAYSQASAVVVAFAGVAVLIVGGAQVAAGNMTVGELLGFYAALALMRAQLSLMLVAAPHVIAGRQSLLRLERLLEPLPPAYSGRRRIDFEGAVELRAVTFGYADGAPVLEAAQLEVAAGDCVALVGPNGAGKTTIVRLALGLYRPRQGELLADGVPYEELDLAHLRRQVGYVPQEPLLVPGTLAENIAYGRPEAAGADVEAAARAAGADGLVRTLPDGYDTSLGDGGQSLSGGQRQRVAIARALIGEPRLLVLDEPTNNLDERAIALLLDAVRGGPRRPSVLLVSHDPAVSSLADRTYAVAGGRVEELSRAAGPVAG